MVRSLGRLLLLAVGVAALWWLSTDGLVWFTYREFMDESTNLGRALARGLTYAVRWFAGGGAAFATLRGGRRRKPTGGNSGDIQPNSTTN